jgi:hypothetical protein
MEKKKKRKEKFRKKISLFLEDLVVGLLGAGFLANACLAKACFEAGNKPEAAGFAGFACLFLALLGFYFRARKK